MFTNLQTGEENFIRLRLIEFKEIQILNKQGKMPADLNALSMFAEEEDNFDFGDVTGAVELPPEKRNKKRRKGRRNRPESKHNTDKKPTRNKSNTPLEENKKETKKPDAKNRNQQGGRNQNRRKNQNNKNKHNNNPPKK